jgi:hypothetical protein
VQLVYVSTDRFEDEPGLVASKTAREAQIWRAMEALSHEQGTNATSGLTLALTEMFGAARAERFAFASQVPTNMAWMLMAGSVLAIGALGYHLSASGSRHIVLTSLLLVMWAGGIVLIADLNRPRIGAIRVDRARLRWTIEDFPAIVAKARPQRPLSAPQCVRCQVPRANAAARAIRPILPSGVRGISSSARSVSGSL